MGTHPIFESDFDCLTDVMRSASRDDDDEACIRIGEKYQALIPDVSDEVETDVEVEQCIWNPTDCADEALESFLTGSKKLDWPEYQSLSLLHFCQGDTDKATEYVESLEPESISDLWSDEDRATFESGFSIFGKNFFKIGNWLKHKSVGDIVEFYYYLKSKSELKSPRTKGARHRTYSCNVDSLVKRCKFSSEGLDITNLTKKIDQTMCDVKADNSVENSLLELRNETDRIFQIVSEACVEKTKPSIIYRWEDQEIYYFSLGIKDFGKDYTKIAKIIQTKNAAQLEKFYNENHEKFLLSKSYEEFLTKNKQA